jgi:hypothetical protein
MAGVNVPLHACEHFYIVSEPIDGLNQLPVLRVPDECAYYKEDAGKMMLGAFEPKSKPWAMDGIPADFEFDQLPEDFDHFEPILEMAVNRMPMLGEAGIHTFFNGPESFTPDDAYHLGLAPEMDNVWIAAGFNSIGIQSAGGAGMALSQWMDSGEKPFDLGDVDISRMNPFQGNKTYLFERSKETWACFMQITSPIVKRPPHGAFAAHHSITIWTKTALSLANWRDGNARTGSRMKAKNVNINTAGNAKTGLKIPRANTEQFEKMWECTICPHSGKSGLRAVMPRHF